MAATGSFVANGVTWTPVRALSFCDSITINENRSVPGFPRGDFLIMKVPSPDGIGVQETVAGGTSAQVQAGASYTFSKHSHYAPKQIAGFVLMAISNVGNVTFSQDEDQI